MWLLERARREGSLQQRRFHTKAQSRATKAQRRNWNLFVALWLGFVPWCEKTTRRARRIAVPVRSSRGEVQVCARRRVCLRRSRSRATRRLDHAGIAVARCHTNRRTTRDTDRQPRVPAVIQVRQLHETEASRCAETESPPNSRTGAYIQRVQARSSADPASQCHHHPACRRNHDYATRPATLPSECSAKRSPATGPGAVPRSYDP